MSQSFNIVAELCRRLASDCQLNAQPRLEWAPPDPENIGSIAGVLITLPDESHIILVERSYRPGVYGTREATEEQVNTFRRGDKGLWELWNDETFQTVTTAMPDEESEDI